MRTFCRLATGSLCGLAIILSGCWMGGNTRSMGRPPAGNPSPPTLNSPQYGPSVPFAPIEPNAPALDGPVLDGPAFPQSSAGDAIPADAFNRKRHTQRPPGGPGSEYAGTAAPPFILDGPIAAEQPRRPQRTVGFIELPPAP